MLHHSILTIFTLFPTSLKNPAHALDGHSICLGWPHLSFDLLRLDLLLPLLCLTRELIVQPEGGGGWRLDGTSASIKIAFTAENDHTS